MEDNTCTETVAMTYSISTCVKDCNCRYPMRECIFYTRYLLEYKSM